MRSWQILFAAAAFAVCPPNYFLYGQSVGGFCCPRAADANAGSCADSCALDPTRTQGRILCLTTIRCPYSQPYLYGLGVGGFCTSYLSEAMASSSTSSCALDSTQAQGHRVCENSRQCPFAQPYLYGTYAGGFCTRDLAEALAQSSPTSCALDPARTQGRAMCACPSICSALDTQGGSPLDGGVPLTGGMYCTQFRSVGGYCGTTAAYQNTDCRVCSVPSAITSPPSPGPVTPPSSCGPWKTGTLTGYDNLDENDDPSGGSFVEYGSPNRIAAANFLNNVPVVSIHNRDWAANKYRYINIKYGGKTAMVQVWDHCSNDWCPIGAGSTCCDTNAAAFNGGDPFLLDVESRTLARLFGISDYSTTYYAAQYQICQGFDANQVASTYGYTKW